MTISPKVAASTIGAALCMIVCSILAALGYDASPALQGSITVLIVFALGYLRVDPARAKR
jgi:hypothetical protein